jgi:hypothetical protein
MDLLTAISSWDRPVVVEALSAHALQGDRMSAELEIGYAIK